MNIILELELNKIDEPIVYRIDITAPGRGDSPGALRTPPF
jgi:hypothetical protein